MASLAFDTLKAAKALRSAGFDEAQAEAVISTVGDAVGGNVSTKADLQEVRAETKADLQELRAEMKADLQEVRVEMKADLQEVRAETKADLQELRSEMKADLQDLELRVMDKFESLYKHLWAMSVGIVAAVVALMKLLS